MNSYKNLIVWQKAMDLACQAYRAAALLPKIETYGLADQMRRAAISIPSNIAEGYGRESTAEYTRFLYIARGSVCEMETQLELCLQLGYLTCDQTKAAQNLCAEVGKLLNAILKRIRNNSVKNSTAPVSTP